MITKEFRKTAGFAESPSDSVSQSAIISFNANSMFICFPVINDSVSVDFLGQFLVFKVK
jgi:hypothetical protein